MIGFESKCWEISVLAYRWSCISGTLDLTSASTALKESVPAFAAKKTTN